jgi:hypothetical protein
VAAVAAAVTVAVVRIVLTTASKYFNTSAFSLIILPVTVKDITISHYFNTFAMHTTVAPVSFKPIC